MENGQNAEALHSKGQGKGVQTTPEFVNPGTPAQPLATLADTESPEISKEASARLREGLIK